MVHATRIRKGKAAYANHWVQTSCFKQERGAGRALFLKARRSRPRGRAVMPGRPAWTHLGR
jgi:carotenoid cleavage dioxygenase-like enzyme